MYFSLKNILLALIFAGIIAGGTNISFARWATYQDAETKVENITKTLYIKRDRTSSGIYEIRTKLLKENAISRWTNYTYSYNSNSEPIKILEAYTLEKGKKYNVNLNKIREQSIPIKPPSGKQTKIVIPYSNVRVGSVVYLKYQLNFKTELDNFDSRSFTFGNQFYAHSASIYVTSELPLFISINDPDKILNIKKSTKKEKNKMLYCLEIHQHKPIYKDIIDEDKIYFNLKYVPIVSIVAAPTQTHFEKVVAMGYEQIKNQRLPVLYQEIANIANTKPNIIDKIDTVIALLHQNITYLITPKYRTLPQPLQQVADTGRGNCKDFSTATCRILQTLGIPTKIALIKSGEAALPFPSDVPGMDTNHVIVKVELPEGPLWLDPTCPVGMSRYISPCIANRKALVLYEDYATYEDIPPTKPEDYRIIKHEIWDMKDLSKIQIKGHVQLLGYAAGSFTGQKNILSEEAIKEKLLSSTLKNGTEVLNYDITLPNLTSRIIKDLDIGYSMTVKIPESKIKTGNVLPILLNTRLFMSKEDAVSAIHLGPPRIFETYITLENIDLSEEKDLNCHFNSPWAYLSRIVQYEKDKHQVLIHKKMKIKKNWIDDTELVGDAYKQLKLNISQNFKDN